MFDAAGIAASLSGILDALILYVKRLEKSVAWIDVGPES
jgi:hypothetical protein